MEQSSNRQTDSKGDLIRKVYNNPRIEIYGNLQDITQAGPGGAHTDGMSGTGMSNTSQ